MKAPERRRGTPGDVEFLKILKNLKIKGPRKAFFLNFLEISAFFKILKIPKILKKKKQCFLRPPVFLEFLKILKNLKIKGPRKACFLEFLEFSAFFTILKIPKILEILKKQMLFEAAGIFRVSKNSKKSKN